MDERTLSQIEAMEPAEISFLAGVALPCPERQENLRLLKFLDATINRRETTLDYSQVSGTSGHHFVVFSVKNISTKGAVTVSELQASRANNSFFTDNPVVDQLELDDEELEEIDPEELEAMREREPDETEQDDAQLVCKYLRAFSKTVAPACSNCTLSRIHLAIVDGKPPSPELVHSLILQFALKNRIPLKTSSSAAPAAVTACVVNTDFSGIASTTARHAAVGTCLVADGLEFLAQQIASSVSLFALVPGSSVVPQVLFSKTVVPLRRFDSTTTRQLPLMMTSPHGSPAEIFVVSPKSSFFANNTHVATCVHLAYSAVTGLFNQAEELSTSLKSCCQTLLATDEPLCTHNVNFTSCVDIEMSDPSVVHGALQNSPLYIELGCALAMWHSVATKKAGDVPFITEAVGLLKDDEAIRDEVEALLLSQESTLLSGVETKSSADIAVLLKHIGVRGIALLLRCRLTVGSTTALEKGILPASTKTLLRAFKKPHEPTQVLTVGARALAKHIHRDRTDSWWGPGGELKGTQAVKNQLALSIVQRILDECVWTNVHMLPHDIVALEYRVAEGYGARWTAEVNEASEVQFRGFLEPADPDGHEKGWQH